jgi:acyl CoA:acetate/3-ketoacid CoA transferase beta subunit
MAARAARELRVGFYVNLGIGILTRSSPRSTRINVSKRESSPWLIATTVIAASSRSEENHATNTPQSDVRRCPYHPSIYLDG